jgi:hypothetical protein
VLGELAAFQLFEFSGSGFPNRIDAAIARVPKGKVTDAMRMMGAPQRALD